MMVPLCFIAHKYMPYLGANSRHQTSSQGGKTKMQSHFSGDGDLSQYEKRLSKPSKLIIRLDRRIPLSRHQMMESVVSMSKLRCQDTRLETWTSIHLVVTSSPPVSLENGAGGGKGKG